MDTEDLIQWVLDECVTALSNSSTVSLSTPTSHVDIADAHDGETYPFVGVQTISSTPRSAGIGAGTVFVDETTYSNGVLQSITFRRESDIRLNIIPVTDNDPARRDNLITDIGDHFGIVARTGQYPTDMDQPAITETTPSDRTDEFVRESAVTIETRYDHFFTYDDPDVFTDIVVDMDVADGDSDIVEDSDADAFEERITE